MDFQRTKEDEIIHQMKSINKRLRNGFDKKLQTYGLTSQQGRIIFFINWRDMNNELTHQKDLESHFSLSKSTVSGIVSRLESNGFITKEVKSPYVVLRLTKQGKDIIKTFDDGRSDMNKKLFNNVSEEVKDKLFEYLNKLIANMEEQENNDK